VVGHEPQQRKRESLRSNGCWRILAVGEKPAQWSVIGQGDRLPASSQLYLASQTGGLLIHLHFVVADSAKKFSTVIEP